eukprot:34683-Alexandrium_andersonii.AAC.1
MPQSSNSLAYTHAKGLDVGCLVVVVAGARVLEGNDRHHHHCSSHVCNGPSHVPHMYGLQHHRSQTFRQWTQE